jgi:hypothetical protein
LISLDGITQLIASGGRIKISRTSTRAKNIVLGNSRRGSFIAFTWTAFISIPVYAMKLLTISTMLATPVHSGRMLLAVIGAADGLPCNRYRMPRMTSCAPGVSVPTSTPLDAGFAITPIPPRTVTNKPSQKTTMISPPG